jgi:hypothetical protein
MKRAAIILCGQIRNLDFCVQTMHEYLFPYYHSDIFCATQDCNCIKPRIYTGNCIVNQYIFFPINYNINNFLNDLFKTRLKKTNIRSGVYTNAVKNISNDLVLSNNIGWADNFKEMQMALDMAFDYEKEHNFKYDIFIKLRPDICFCKPFNNIPDKLPDNSIYVNNKDNRFIWDAVFAMDPLMAKYLRNFYDYYINIAKKGLENCFEWKCNLNAEEQLLHFINLQNSTIIDLGDVGYPFTWLIGDIKNNLYWTLRHKKFNLYWQNKFINYATKCTSCYFDIRKNIPLNINYNMPKNSKTNKKIALLISGQLRDFEFCFQSIVEFILPHYEYDIYISTQDAICIKPRLGCGIYNQYIVLKSNYNQFVKTANYNIRSTYDDYIKDQKSNLCFNTINGPDEIKKDIKNNINMAMKSDIKYDLYLHIRADVLIGRHINKIKENSVLGENLMIAMDYENALLYPNCKLNNINDFVAYPLKWLISDLNSSNKKRHLEYGRKWSLKIEQYAKDFHQCIFDLYT